VIAVRHGWRDTVRLAADLALLGFLVTGAALAVVTGGAAVATGSAAVRHHLDYDSWPSARACWAQFRRALAPGLAAVAGVLAAGVLIAVDVLALRTGAVPGGRPMMLVMFALAAATAGFAGLVVVAAVDRPAGTRVLAAALATSVARPGTLAAATGVVALAAVLAVLVHPVLVPVLVGYALFALHVVARRPAPGPRPNPTS
jgi:hypothetical protein